MVCNPEKKRFFDWLAKPLAAMAGDLGTTQRILLTLAAHEGGWTTDALDHNQPLNNPFGANRTKNRVAVGNLRYQNLDAATLAWKNTFGPRVQGIQEPLAFVYALQHPKPGQGQPYNSASQESYSDVFMAIYGSMGRYMEACGISK